jgi:hypothetical protein
VEGENEAGRGAVFKEVAFHKMRAGRSPGPTISVARSPTGESTHFRCCIHGAHLLSIEYVLQNGNTPVHLPAPPDGHHDCPRAPAWRLKVRAAPLFPYLSEVEIIEKCLVWANDLE